MNLRARNVILATLAITCLTYAGAPQFKQILKVVGVGAAVKQFGPDINKALNRLQKHTDTTAMSTKVVPIISAGIGSRQSVGAAQVMGPKARIAKVAAVAQLEQDLFGKEVKIRAMIPVSSKDFTDIKRVEGVAVSGIVDLKL